MRQPPNRNSRLRLLPPARPAASPSIRHAALLQALVALLALSATGLFAQGWETVFTLPPAKYPDSSYYYERWPTSLLQDPFGPPDSGSSRLMVGMDSEDQHLYRINLTSGTSQGRLFDLPGEVGSLAYDPVTGNVFASSRFGWRVRSSVDQGESWTHVDSFAGNGATTGMTVDAVGNLYVCGNTNAANGRPTWFVRKSADQGTTWSTVDRVASANAIGILFVPGTQGGLFVAGSRESGGWVVRRSRDAGVTWQQVDSFVRSGKDTFAGAMASDAWGRVYVAGRSSPDPVRWEVRLSEDGGSTWKTISPPNATAQSFGLPGALVVDWSGTLFLAGTLDAWAVARRSPDGVWEDPEFPFGIEAGWVASQATAMTMDAAGNILVAGRVRSWVEPDRVGDSLVIQRLAATVLPPLTVEHSGRTVTVGWPAALSGVELESSGSCDPTATWTSVSVEPTLGATAWTVKLPSDGETRFFRLRKLRQ